MSKPDLNDPLARLKSERLRARALGDPWANLCALASVKHSGQAQVRTLVLRDLGTRLAVFFNNTSPKWSELKNQPGTQLLIYLDSIAVQYRLDATLELVPQQLVHESWQMRPDIPKGMDWYYTDVQAQSSAVESRNDLKTSFTEQQKQNKADSAPASACGTYLNLNRIERLELLEDDLHDRCVWQLVSKHWTKQTLIP